MLARAQAVKWYTGMSMCSHVCGVKVHSAVVRARGRPVTV